MDLKKQYIIYKNWVIENPKNVAEFEAIVKWGSYFLAGRFKNSGILCEIIYAGSRLFELFNDFLVCGKFPQLNGGEFNKLTILLTVVEYVEVLVEVSASQLWGETGRWVVVCVIQLLKSIWRLILLFRNKMCIIPSPPIKPIDRIEAQNYTSENLMPNGFDSFKKKGVVRLPRSGRVMRTLEGTPPAHLRTFSPPSSDEYDPPPSDGALKPIPMNQLAAEVLHVFRPLGHLSSMYLFGVESWVPWCLAFGIDLTSLHLHGQSVLTREEKRELVKRRLSLLYYLIRTPAFHKVTHRRIKQFLITVGNSLPLARYVCQPLLEYVPEWQKIYSYTWS